MACQSATSRADVEGIALGHLNKVKSMKERKEA
jgi:hypothetical protein